MTDDPKPKRRFVSFTRSGGIVGAPADMPRYLTFPMGDPERAPKMCYPGKEEATLPEQIADDPATPSKQKTDDSEPALPSR